MISTCPPYAAFISAVPPSRSVDVAMASAPSRAPTASTRPSRQARMSGLWSSSFTTLTRAPAVIISFTISSNPWATAQCSAVLPNWSIWLMSPMARSP